MFLVPLSEFAIDCARVFRRALSTSRFSSLGAFAMISLCVQGPPAFAQGGCVLPDALTTFLQELSNQGSPLDAQMHKAFAEADIPSPACTAQAKADFSAITAHSANEKDAITTANGALAYLGAVQSWEQGDIPSAITQANNVVTTYSQLPFISAPLLMQGLTFLMNLIAGAPTSPEWNFISAKLETISTWDNYDGFAVNAIQQLAMHDITLGKSSDGLGRLEAYLRNPLPSQARFEAQIALLETMNFAKDFDDAQILTTAIDQVLGYELLDVGWRVRYLAASANAWAASTTTDGKARAARYRGALTAAQGATQ
jgi:hypothetical protein